MCSIILISQVSLNMDEMRQITCMSFKDYIRPVCLPWGRASDSEVTNHIATLTGWGDTEYGKLVVENRRRKYLFISYLYISQKKDKYTLFICLISLS